MTVQLVREDVELPARADEVGRAVVDGLRAARCTAAEVDAAVLQSLDADELTAVVEEAAGLEAQAAAVKLAALAEADRRRLAQELGASGTDAWAARLTGTTRGVAAGGIWLARLLEEKYDATREAFAAGTINVEQARVIVRAAERLPDGVTDAQRREAEAGLVARAVEGLDPARLRRAARRMLEVVSKEAADEHEATQLQEDERAADNETWMWLQDRGNGTFEGRFVIPELDGSLLLAYLERLSSPRKLARNRAGDLVQDDTLPTDGPQLSGPELMGLALTELVEHLPADGFGRGGAGVMVHLDYQHLLDGLASARLDTGAIISAGEARRLACTAGIIPAVFGGRSVPLDLGYESRLFSTGQARALSARHDTCAAEGCQRPFAWCDIHHRAPWSKRGPTDLANAVPLCGWHHRRAHDSRFDLAYLPTGEVRYKRRR